MGKKSSTWPFLIFSWAACQKRGEQILVVFVKDLAQHRRGQEEGGEFFREDVVPGHRIPDLARHFGLEIRRRRDRPEIAVGHVFDFVVVVEDDAAVAGHAEVLPQHVAGEDVGLGEFADGAAVFADGVFQAFDVVAALHLSRWMLRVPSAVRCRGA